MTSQGESEHIDMEVEESKEERKDPPVVESIFDSSDPSSIKLEVEVVSDFTFTWINKILCYDFQNKYLVIHDLMKGISLLNNTRDNFEFHNEKLILIDSSLLIVSHKINNSLFLCQDDHGNLNLIGVEKERVNRQLEIFKVTKKAQYQLNERITSFLSLNRRNTENNDIAFSTTEGNIYLIKLLENEMISFISKIQFNILKRLTSSLEENEKLLKKYDEGFNNAFNGNLISEFFDVDLKQIKQLLNDIKSERQKEGEENLKEYNLLSLKMLFF